MSDTGQAGVRSRAWRDGRVEADNFPPGEFAERVARRHGLVWMDVFRPDESTLGEVLGAPSFGPHLVEDATSLHERPKASVDDERVFVTGSPVAYDAARREIDVGRLSAFCMKGALVTVRLDETVDLDEVLQRWSADRRLVAAGSLGLLHGLLDVVVDRYLDVLEEVARDLGRAEDVLFTGTASSSTQVTRRTFAVRRVLIDLGHAVVPMRDVVSSVRNAAAEDPQAAVLQPYYDDLTDHVEHAGSVIEVLADSVGSVLDTSSALVDNRLNQIMKQLTAWAGIIAVPTAITGFYGQNVLFPGYNGHWAFWFSTAVIVVLVGALYVVFKRKHWL